MGCRARLELPDGGIITVSRGIYGYRVTYAALAGEVIPETVDTSDRAIDASLMVTTGHALRLRRQPLIRRIQDRAAALGIVVTRESRHVLSSIGGGITILPPDEVGRPGVGRSWDGASLHSHSDWDLITYALDALLA